MPSLRDIQIRDPFILRAKGSYYLFGSTVLFAEDPAGPYRPWSSGSVTPAHWDCLDGTLYVDGSGSPWMVFCHEWQQVGDGQICALPLQTDLKAPAGPAQLLFRASEAPWAKPLAGRAPGSYVTDGPFLYKARNGTLLMLWSSFGAGENYCIGAAASPSGMIDGPWTQAESPLYAAVRFSRCIRTRCPAMCWRWRSVMSAIRKIPCAPHWSATIKWCLPLF